MARRPVFRFPIRDGNGFRLLVDGSAFYPPMLEAIHSARRYVLMEMYLVVPGRVAGEFAAALIEAAGRGLTVQVLLDGFGSLKFLAAERERLERGGVQVAVYNPLRFVKWKRNLLRTHRKILVTDGERAFVGGAGLGDMFTGPRAWRETMIEARGRVVEDWQKLFADAWQAWSDRDLPALAESRPHAENRRGRVVGSRRGSPNVEIKRRLLNYARRADRRLWLTTPYFVPSRKIRRALRRAAWRGVDTRVLLPGPVTDHPGVRFASRRFYARLLRHGVKIFEYQKRFIHTKVVVADDWCSIGSCNMDRWNLRWNLEANQEIEDVDFVDEVARMLETDFAASRRIRWRDWRERSWIHRFREWLWGNVDIFLARVTPPRRRADRRTSGLSPGGPERRRSGQD